MTRVSVREQMEMAVLALGLADEPPARGKKMDWSAVQRSIVDRELKKLAIESARHWFASALRERLKELDEEWRDRREHR